MNPKIYQSIQIYVQGNKVPFSYFWWETKKNEQNLNHMNTRIKKNPIFFFFYICSIYENKWNIQIKALEFDSNFIAKLLLLHTMYVCFYTVGWKDISQTIFMFNLERNVSVLLKEKKEHLLNKQPMGAKGEECELHDILETNKKTPNSFLL